MSRTITMPWWWLSFADEDGFLGAAIVRGVDALDAVRRSHRLGLNPGGEVRCRGPIEYADALDVTIERNATREAARQQLGASVGPFHSQADAETVRDALLLLRTWAYKSNALARLIYGDEPLRAEECPVHKGRWSGCEWPTPECGCDDGSNVTGWLRPVEGADRG